MGRYLIECITIFIFSEQILSTDTEYISKGVPATDSHRILYILYVQTPKHFHECGGWKYVYVHLYIYVDSCSCMDKHMWRPKVNVGNHPQLLFHCVH